MHDNDWGLYPSPKEEREAGCTCRHWQDIEHLWQHNEDCLLFEEENENEPLEQDED